jgi:hydrogenase maturation protease
MTTTLIIGYGNPLRGDDGIGWAAAELLADCMVDAETRVLARHQLTPELAEQAARFKRVVLIDASVDLVPGDILVEKIEPTTSPVTTFSHDLDPTTLVTYTQQLYGATPESWLVSVGGMSFEDGDALSPPIAAKLQELLCRVRELVQVHA